MTARGGNSGYRGGGGAIAIEYSDPDSESAPWVGKLNAQGWTYSTGSSQSSGAGTIWLKGPSATYGTLTVDNKGVLPGQATELPSLGSGLALSGSSGATLVTDRSASILSYFEGHWVEISGADGTVKGVAQISDIHEDRLTVTLEPEGAETLSVAAGDSWRGVYRFDEVILASQERLYSEDPILTGTDAVLTLVGTEAPDEFVEYQGPIHADVVEVRGRISVSHISSRELRVKAGAVLTHPLGRSQDWCWMWIVCNWME